MKSAVVILGLLLLLLANVLMVMRSPLSPYLAGAHAEGFQNVAMAAATNALAPPTTSLAVSTSTAPSMGGAALNAVTTVAPMNTKNFVPPTTTADMAYPNAPVKEGFRSYFLENAGGAKEQYQPIGAYDGVQLKTGNDVSVWRYTSPNEKLLGDEFQPGPDSLFMFKNNQCKPECCGASFSCGGGCVCTTPQQRQYIASRGGNRTAPEDSA